MSNKVPAVLKHSPRCSRWLTAFAGMISLCCLAVNAQQPTSQSPKPGDPKAVTAMNQTAPPPVAGSRRAASTDDHYRIGPGDVLDVRIVNRPNLSRDNVRVEGDGTIRMPLIEGSIQAACQTETELEKEITSR